MGMPSPKSSHGEVGGVERGHTGQRKNKAQDTDREAPTFEQTSKDRRTHPHIKNHHDRYTVRAGGHSCTSAMGFRPGGTRGWRGVLSNARHAHAAQEPSCPGLKDELQNHKGSGSFFRENPSGYLRLNIPFFHYLSYQLDP